jgi:PAS domain S-box-containing protein
MKSSNQKLILGGLALAFGVLIFVAFLLLVSADQENKNAASVVHTRDVLDKIDELVGALGDAETGRRGFIISGQERYWTHFTNQVEHTYQSLRQLRTLTQDNPPQSDACDRLLPFIQQRLLISTNSLQARQQNGLDSAAQTGFIEQGQTSMESVRELAAAMASRESTLLKQRLAVQDKNIKGVEGFAVLIGFCGMGLFAAFFVLFMRADARRRHVEDELERSNQALEQRVKQRTSELSQSEQRVAQERNLLRTVIDSLPADIYLKDVSGRYVLNNAANLRTLNATSEAATLGKTVSDFFPEETATSYELEDRQVLGSSKPLLNREVRAKRPSGEDCWLLTTKVPLRDPKGTVSGLLGISQDITERKHLEEMRTRLAAIVESSDDAIFSKTLDGIVTSWNPGAERLFGYAAREAIGHRMERFVPPENVVEESEVLARVARGEAVHHFETQRLKSDGTAIEVSLTISPIRDENGLITGASKIARDITQTKEAEEKLRIQLARLDLLSHTTRAIGERQDLASIFQIVLRSLEDNLPIDFGCICLYEPAVPRLIVANVGAKSLDLAQDMAMGEHAHIDIDQNGLSRCVNGELVYEPDIVHSEFPFPRRLAQAGLASLVIAPLLVESQVFGVLVAARRQPGSFTSSDCEFLRQLSEHVALAAHQAQLYGALQQAYDDLRKTQQAVAQQERLRALGQMASGIAHDINNAISPIAIYTESLLEREPNLSPRARDYLQTISSAIDDVAATVVRMREFYRQREPQLTLAPVQLNELVEQVLSLTRARWSDMPQQRGFVIETRTDLAKDLPTIMGVDNEIREALTNLILNAVDAMPEGGTLTIRTRRIEPSASVFGPGAPSASVEVIDTGIGMDEDTQRRCVEPFFTTKGERGTGLGLAMVYGMAQRHSAEIEVESALGKGTTIRLSFAARDAAIGETSQSESVPVVPSRLRILLVDDDPMLLKSVCDALEGDGHQVITANGGQAGIEAFSSRLKSGNPFDLVITDLGMPYIDGRRVASTIKGLSSSTPVIMLTGWGHRLKAKGDLPDSVDRVLSKPPKLAELRRILAHFAALLPPKS